MTAIYFMSVYGKSKVYVNNPTTFKTFGDYLMRITREISLRPMINDFNNTFDANLKKYLF